MVVFMQAFAFLKGECSVQERRVFFATVSVMVLPSRACEKIPSARRSPHEGLPERRRLRTQRKQPAEVRGHAADGLWFSKTCGA